MRSIRKVRVSYIVVVASAVELSLTGCWSEAQTVRSCDPNHPSGTCPTVNPAPMVHPEENPVNPPRNGFDFDTLSFFTDDTLAFTMEKAALDAQQMRILESLPDVTKVKELSCASELGVTSYKLMLFSSGRIVHTFISSNGYCPDVQGLIETIFVETTVLQNFYLTRP